MRRLNSRCSQVSSVVGIALLLSIASGVCIASEQAARGADIVTERAALGADALRRSHERGPWPMGAFASVSAGAESTKNIFEGRLTIKAQRAETGFHVLLDRYGDASAHGGAASRLPSFAFEFVQADGALIPVRRGAIASDHAEWEFILEPGRVWDENTDAGYTRAALPFALEERNANCMHNGVLTFLFRNDGSVSDVAFEIAQETCAYFQFDWWGYATAHYVPDRVIDREGIVVRYRDELRSRLPTRPISNITADFTGVDAQHFASPREVPAPSLTTHGVIANGVHYIGDCPTRQGPYPYCDVLDLPSYSLAKTVVGAIATLSLARSYPEIATALISNLVPECAAARGWQGVTVVNTLDMATGRYLSAADQQDEDGADMLEFFLADRHDPKLRFGCTHYPHRVSPGTAWVYHTADTYVLGAALTAFYRMKKGADADFYDDVLAKGIWPALHLSPVLDVPRRTYDSARQPFTGYGLTLHRDDIAKIAKFLSVDLGRAGDGADTPRAGEPAGIATQGDRSLDSRLLDEAMQRVPARPGLQAGSADLRYQHGFWAWNAQQALGCRKATWIPFMSGYGGIIVAMMPNGITYYYFSDGGVHRWAMAAAEADRLRPFCAR